MKSAGNCSSGFTLIEVMMAVAISGLMLSSLFFYVNQLITDAQNSHHRLSNIFILQEQAAAQSFEELLKKEQKKTLQNAVNTQEFPPVRGSALRAVAQLMIYQYTIEHEVRPESLINIRFKQAEKKTGTQQ